MKMFHKIYLHLLVFSCLGLSSVQLTFGCGGGWDLEGEYYSFFHQTVISDQTLYPFLHSPEQRYFWGEGDKEMKDPNIAEWEKYFGIGDAGAPFTELIYGVSLNRMNEVHAALHGVDNSSLTEWGLDLRKKRNRVLVNYLIFAKKCEKHARTQEYSWYYAQNVDVDEIDQLMKEGLELYKSAGDKFMKLRYGFQLVRLAHYSGKTDLAIKLFDEKVKMIGVKNYIYYRALEQKAGALNKTNSAEAAYIFSRIFELLPDRRVQCMNSFGFTDASSWNESLSYCKTHQERSVFYVMRGFKEYGDEMVEMEKVAEIDPKSSFLELMMARQINKAERNAFPTYMNHQDRTKLGFPVRGSGARQIKVIEQVLSSSKVKNRDFWMYAKGFFKLIDYDFDGARKSLKKIKKGSDLYEDAFALQFALKLIELKELRGEQETQMWDEFKKDGVGPKCTDLGEFMMDVFNKKYAQQGDDVKAYLCLSPTIAMRENLELTFLEKLERYYSRKDLNAFEEHLAIKSTGGLQDVIEMKGTWYLKNADYANAIGEFKKLSAAVTSDIPGYESMEYYQPHLFGGDFRHWYSTPFEEQCDNVYKKYDFLGDAKDKLTLAQTLLKLEDMAKKGGNESANYYYLLGNAYYNMSPAGWHRPILHYREGNYSHNLGDGYSYNVAEDYYEKARMASTDKEFKAKMTYMMAKVEQAFGYNGLRKNESGSYFEELVEQYANTNYYQEVLDECGYFRDYVN